MKHPFAFIWSWFSISAKSFSGFMTSQQSHNRSKAYSWLFRTILKSVPLVTSDLSFVSVSSLFSIYSWLSLRIYSLFISSKYSRLRLNIRIFSFVRFCPWTWAMAKTGISHFGSSSLASIFTTSSDWSRASTINKYFFRGIGTAKNYVIPKRARKQIDTVLAW